MKQHPIVSPAEWTEARLQLLAKEKEFTRLQDQMSRMRRELPWERVEKNYQFESAVGMVSLADLFLDTHQLVVYHFMFDPRDEEACADCSFWADTFDAVAVHLFQRDLRLVAVSRAPIQKLTAFKERMGWKFPWVSSGASDFNYDFQASFAPEAQASATAYYNYAVGDPKMPDREGVSVFYKDDGGTVFHTYSAYARGIDLLNCTYQFLDLAPLGRNEDGHSNPLYWVRHHDTYDRMPPG